MTHWSSNWSIVNEILSGEEVDIFNPSLISELHKLRSSKKYLNTKGKEMIGKLDGLLKFLRVREMAVSMEKCKNGRSVQFLSCANDDVSCNSDFAAKTLSSFLSRGDLSYVTTTDINHNCKNARYQLIGLNSIVTMRVNIVDVGMVERIGIPQDLWKVVDWASYGLVLSLASVKTCSTILHSKESDTGKRITLALSLYFQRVYLFTINYKETLNYEIRVCLLWSSLIFFLHLHGVSIITKRNWIVAAIANSFLMIDQTVIHPHKATSEPCEHIFRHARSFKRDFTIRDFTQIVSKISRRFEIMYRNEFVISRNKLKCYDHDIGQGTKCKVKCHDKNMIEHTDSGWMY